MDWSFFFILTVQILIWFVVLGLPLYLLVGSLAGAVARGAIGGVLGTTTKILAAAKTARDQKIL